MATTETVVPVDPKHYVWWFPGSPVKVHLDLQVVQRLKQRLWENGAGNSEGGLLFGKTRDGATEIVDFQAVVGSRIASAVAALPVERKQALVGYYRTEESETFHLNDEDRSLAEECFAKPYQVYLMIHPNGFGPPNATFFFHDGDGRMRDFAFLEFAFDPPLLASEEHERIQRSHQVTLAQPLSLPAPSLIPPAAGEQRKKRSSLLRIVGWAASIAAVFALGMALSTGSIREKAPRIWRAIALSLATASSSSPTALPSSRTSLALHAVRQNGDLELTWNRNSPLITAATSGVISIQDGESKRFVALDSAQLRGAGILYSPTSDQVLMQLAVTTPDGTVTEAVTAILPKAGGPSSAQPVAQQPSESASALSPSQNTPPVRASRAFDASVLAKTGATSPTPILRDPPTLRIPAIAPASVPNVVAQTPQIQRPEPPVIPQQQHAAAITTYEPPLAIVKTQPVVPSELRHLIFGQTTVQVKVTIDNIGRVTKAEAIPEGNTARFLLAFAATAARSWRFQPARHDHEPISSEAILRFVFKP